jgi:hypothetical protein
MKVTRDKNGLNKVQCGDFVAYGGDAFVEELNSAFHKHVKEQYALTRNGGVRITSRRKRKKN